MIICLGPALLRGSSGQPGSLGRAILPPRRFRRRRSPIWPCSGWGLPCRPCHQDRGALLPHLFTLTPPRDPFGPLRGAVCFLWHFPWGHPRSALPTTLPCGVRTFLPPRLAARGATTRPSPAEHILPYPPTAFNRLARNSPSQAEEGTTEGLTIWHQRRSVPAIYFRSHGHAVKTDIPISEARRQLSRLVKELERDPGRVFAITFRGRVVAELQAARPSPEPGLAARKLLEIMARLPKPRGKARRNVSTQVKKHLYGRGGAIR